MFDFKKIRNDIQTYLDYFIEGDKFGTSLGHKIIELNHERCLSEYQVRNEHFNPNGILHGGALYSAMDSAQGAFLHFVLPENFAFAATGTATIKYLAPVREGRVSLKTELTQQDGRKFFVTSEAQIDDQVVATLEEVWVAKPL